MVPELFISVAVELVKPDGGVRSVKKVLLFAPSGQAMALLE